MEAKEEKRGGEGEEKGEGGLVGVAFTTHTVTS